MKFADEETPLHPGQILGADFLLPQGISGRALAVALQVSHSRASELIAGRRRLNADMALRLGRYFGNSPWFWMDLQARFDMDRVMRRKPGLLEGIVPVGEVGEAG